MKVELERNVWISTFDGRSQTVAKENAADFDCMEDALKALKKAREYRPFENASIQEEMV